MEALVAYSSICLEGLRKTRKVRQHISGPIYESNTPKYETGVPTTQLFRIHADKQNKITKPLLATHKQAAAKTMPVSRTECTSTQ
jgi:hypothetical protein